jgi:hypothetical protein
VSVSLHWNLAQVRECSLEIGEREVLHLFLRVSQYFYVQCLIIFGDPLLGFDAVWISGNVAKLHGVSSKTT